MSKVIREQIDYGDYPERMDPNLERKLKSKESLYATNPAFRKGEKDVSRIATSRFKKVVDKLRQARGLERITPNMIQRIYMEEMSKVPTIIQIESRHKEALEELAKKVSLDETEVPNGWYQIEALLNREPIDVSNFRYEPEEDEDEEDEEDKQNLEIPSFEVEDLTRAEELELEKHKRNIINAIVQGAAKKGHYLFQKPEVKAELDKIDTRLYPAYLGIMAINDFLYFSMEQMIEQMSATGNGVAGKVELQDADEEDEGGENGDGEEKPDTKIVAEGLIFPILTHEIIKGVKAANARFGLPTDPDMREKVKAQVDILSNEPMQLRLGPEVVEKIRYALPDEMFEQSNKGLINWFEIQLYQIPAQEFLEIIGNAISEDTTKQKKATQKFEEIMKEAMELKREYEDYQKEQGTDTEDEDEDDLDDFLGSLGISRPK
jgi:hypothetical protein